MTECSGEQITKRTGEVWTGCIFDGVDPACVAVLLLWPLSFLV